MIVLLIAVIILFIHFVFLKFFAPKIEYIEESNMWICHYNKDNGRDWFIIYKE